MVRRPHYSLLALLVAAALTLTLLGMYAGPGLAAPAGQFRSTLTPTPQPIYLQAPLPGEVLRGSVPIRVHTDVPGFQSAELSFAYSGDPTGVWFLIAESTSPTNEGVLTTWDTSMITDGEYDLRLVVFLANGNRREVQAAGLRVRNYSVVETSTPAPSATNDPGMPTHTATPTASPQPPTPTPLPTNPAIPNLQRTMANLGLGAGITLAFFGGLGVYLLRRAARRG